jgi:nanoRNase/pAp phosphatase (c-di-AMP/oligoRNAs hydrolase)
MDKAIYEQITNLLEKSQKILILAHAKVDCDGIGAALSLSKVFKELGKEVTVATNDPAPENLNFLPSIGDVKNSLSGVKDFVITLDTSKTALEKIKYNLDGDKIHIIVTPKDGYFQQSDISFGQGANKFDLIFVLDTGNLEHLGALYDKNAEMFFETPVINIDHHASNTDFGKVNLVDVTASSTTEILFEYLSFLEQKYNKKFITPDIATLLLAGIITDTGSFQHANTSPRAMETSAKLLDLGARQQEVIKNIFKTKKLSTLKLWGIILSKVQVDTALRMVWSTISRDDMQEAEADPEETEGIIDDLLTNAPGAEVIFLIKQNPEYVSVSMRSTNNQTDVGKFCAENGGGGHVRAAGFKLRDNRAFDEVVNDVIGRVRKFQSERLQTMGGMVGGMVVDKSIIETKPQQPNNSPTTAPREAAPTQEKVTYLDFKAPKPAAQQTPQITDNKSVQPAFNAAQQKTETVNQNPVHKKRHRKRKHKKHSAGISNQPANQTAPVAKPAAPAQPKKETPPPPAPFVAPV